MSILQGHPPRGRKAACFVRPRKKLPPTTAGRPAGRPWPIREAAEFLGISLDTMKVMIAEKRIVTFALCRRKRFVADSELRRVAEGKGGGR